MFLERERGILRALARECWDEHGPGVLFGRLESQLILEAWVPIDRVSEARPDTVREFVSEEAWRWLRTTELTDELLREASPGHVPIVFCLPLAPTPYPHIQCFPG
jgi:hypothetical protein